MRFPQLSRYSPSDITKFKEVWTSPFVGHNTLLGDELIVMIVQLDYAAMALLEHGGCWSGSLRHVCSSGGGASRPVQQFERLGSARPCSC